MTAFGETSSYVINCGYGSYVGPADNIAFACSMSGCDQATSCLVGTACGSNLDGYLLAFCSCVNC
ncbi:MAG TPA: hypothetical protein VMU15_22140 [Anaeromyxobacter sp.]|nr:hypothetical protein [Anaeromyxobacter sp.]